MKYFLPLFLSMLGANVFSQLPGPGKMYPLIRQYYMDHKNEWTYIEHVHRNALGYDTSHSKLLYINLPELNKDAFAIMWLNAADSITSGMIFSDDYYVIDIKNSQKIRVNKRELGGTIYNHLRVVPSFNSDALDKTFGSIKTITQNSEGFFVHTSRYSFVVDTLSYRIKKLISVSTYEGRAQYDEYRFPDSGQIPQELLARQMAAILSASAAYAVTTFDEIEKNAPGITRFVKTRFPFNDLNTYNKGLIGSMVLKDKYVILDFFYLECLPCHKMTKMIMDWIPKIDTSKLILIGVNPANSLQAMNDFEKAKGLNYPVIIEEQAREIRKYYGVHIFPTLFLIAPDGTIEDIHVGMSKSFLKKAEKIIK